MKIFIFINKKKILLFVTTQMNMEDIKLNKISQAEKGNTV